MNISENIGEIASTGTVKTLSIFSMIGSADLISKSVMLILVIASIYSWAIIFERIMVLRQIRQKIAKFEATFWSGQVLDQLYDVAKRHAEGPLSNIFVSAMDECKRIKPKNSADPFMKIGQKERYNQAMYLIKDREVEKLEKNLDILAIIGSNALFVGLFGTVWGIMHSFQSIAASKNTTLAVVAPGIAEALLATAIGLLTAVPCVIFYSYLSSRINIINNKIEDFISELSTILSRAIDEEKL